MTTLLAKPLLAALVLIAALVLSAVAYEHHREAVYAKTVRAIRVEDTGAALKNIKDR